MVEFNVPTTGDRMAPSNRFSCLAIWKIIDWILTKTGKNSVRNVQIYLDIVHPNTHKDIQQGDGHEDGVVVGVSSNHQYQDASNKEFDRIRHNLGEHFVHLA